MDTSTGSGQIISVPRERILRHFMDQSDSSAAARVELIPSEGSQPVVFHSPFYLANISSQDAPLLLELRFEPIVATVNKVAPNLGAGTLNDNHVRIALLMTNERYITDLMAMGSALYEGVKRRRIEFDAIVAMESLGPKLSQEVARVVYEREQRVLLLTSFQKGKPRVDESGNVTVGPPKPWIIDEAGIEVSSGTSHPLARQRLFLDQKVAEYMQVRRLRVLVIDDARMTQGSINTGVALLKRFNIPVAGVATILNEGEPTSEIDGIPYIGLTKLPLFMPVAGGLAPIPGTFRGLDYFYREINQPVS
ncbi:MAG: type I phosphoribosyltransferase [Anaerolineae bacterium]